MGVCFGINHSMKKPSFENKSQKVEKEIQEHAEFILRRLGLKWEDLEGKTTLDIGAGGGDVSAAAKKRGISVVSLDMSPELWKEEGRNGIATEEIPYVKGDAMKLPFLDEQFELVISHAGPLILGSRKDVILAMITEALRVLKKNGELRFGPGYLNANAFTEEELFTKDEAERFSTDERMRRINEKAWEFLKQAFPDIMQENNNVPHDPNDQWYMTTYYKMTKI
jgi:ubiquinone/menaquinone biosynthesis C-methylase UbiE